MQVVVVGGGGYIGGHLVAALLQSGTKVLSMSSRDGTGIDPRTGLFPEPPRVPAGLDAVVYLAQSPLYRRVPETAVNLLCVNVVAAVQLAVAAANSGARKFIYASTGNVYEPSFAAQSESSPLRRDDWYALSKVHAEEALGLFHDRMDVTVARLFGVYGPGQTRRLVPNLIDTVAERRQVVLEPAPGETGDSGGMRISLCYIDDVVNVLQALLTRNNVPVLNIAGDDPVDIRALASRIGQRLGLEAQFTIAERPRALDLIADISLLKRLLAPRFTPLDEGLEGTLSAWSSKP